MPKINNNSPANANLAMEQQRANNAPDRGEKFGKVLSGVATVALKTTATVAPLVPGGVIVGKAAEGVQKLRENRPGGLEGGPQDEIDKMWAMQQENQVFNMQYMQLQQEIQRLSLEVERMTQDAEAEVGQLQQTLQLEFQAKLVPAINRVAAVKGLQFIFNAGEGGLIWADPALDISADIIADLNQSP